jgi:arylsulfatase A-like enzyme
VGFEAEDVLPKLTEKAVDYIASRSEAAKQGTPFFLYLPYASPHTPILPTKAWQGRSELNPYADFVMQTDAAIGQVKQAIDQHGLTDNTLFIVTSDNGCSPQADYPALLAKGHNPSYVYRGHKADIFEGGHRVPYLARWPGKLAAGTRCDALVGLQDTFATIADAVGAKLPENVAVDSFSWLPHVSDSKQPTRPALVHHSINGSFAIRRAQWKLCFCGDSGGWSEPRPGRNKDKTLPAIQLFDLVSDIGETNNVAEAHPEVVAELTDQMQQLIDQGRSTPGPTQSNTTTVRWQNPLEKQ